MLLAGCATLEEQAKIITETAPMRPIEDPTQFPNYQPITPIALTPTDHPPQGASLWRPGAKSFFRDNRASRVGDIIKVAVGIDDSAEFSNSTNSTARHNQKSGVTKLFGLEQELSNLVPGLSPPDLLNLDSTNNFIAPKSTIKRTETLTFIIPAIVQQVLPNGSLVVRGRQEIRLNNEVRQLQVMGIARPVDIDNNNTIKSERLTECRIVYGGEGDISDEQHLRYGQKALDILPF